jgi:hypothetical protein
MMGGWSRREWLVVTCTKDLTEAREQRSSCRNTALVGEAPVDRKMSSRAANALSLELTPGHPTKTCSFITSLLAYELRSYRHARMTVPPILTISLAVSRPIPALDPVTI